MLDRERMLQWQANREEADRKHRQQELRIVRTGVWVAVGAVVIGAVATIVGSLVEARVLFG